MAEKEETIDHRKDLQKPLIQEEKSPLHLTDEMLDRDFEEIYRHYPHIDDTSCGIGFLRGGFLQKLANKKTYVLFYGIAGSVFSATYAYFNGTITTIEKRYKIPSRNMGIISVGSDITSLFISAFLAYYAGKGHRPRWIAFGLFTIALFCLFTSLPHYLYGAGEQALSLTKEFGATENDPSTIEILEKERKKMLCKINTTEEVAECDVGEGNFMPQLILFLGQMLAGVGQSLYYTLGVAYMDDNIKKSKTPALLSFSYFLRLLGPALGYTLASFCLKIFISPDLTPTIDNNDPRWLGGWWIGWLVLSAFILVFAVIMSMFPKELPRAALRKKIASERRKRGMKKVDHESAIDETPPSFKDMIKSFKRLLTNATYMLNNIAGIFYFFGYMPYWIFAPKYIETQYKQSASVSSLVTGTVALIFSAVGILSSGAIISKFRPKARNLALWNVIVGGLTVVGMISYSFLGCAENEKAVVLNTPSPNSLQSTCNSNCQCDFVKYSPVCGSDNRTYISPCHAGCKQSRKNNGTKIFNECSCIRDSVLREFMLPHDDKKEEKLDSAFSKISDFISGSAKDGSCQINCQKEFIMFLSVMCLLKFIGATGRASNFLVGVRCVEERDKNIAMGFGLAFASLFSFMPSPIFFGVLLDRTCIVWGKTCSGKGNCWLYDTESLRIWLNFFAAGFILIGTIFDSAVWYCVKDLKIFDEEMKDKELELVQKDDEAEVEKHT